MARVKFLVDFLLKRKTLLRSLAEYKLQMLFDLRQFEHVKLVLIAGAGRYGGSEKVVLTKYKSAYVVSLDIDPSRRPHIICDLEEPWPLQSDVADLIISTWVLEHLKDPEHFIYEAHRVLKSGGHLVLTVPFIHRVHGAPYDYLRYTDSYFYWILNKHEFVDVSVLSIGGGPFVAAVSLLWPLFKVPIATALTALVAYVLDISLGVIVRATGRGKMLVSSFPVGYVALARKL